MLGEGHHRSHIDIEDLKEKFKMTRPAVPVTVVRPLWHQWTMNSFEGLLFEDEIDNIALYLHAKAHGENVSLPSGCRLTSLLREHKQRYAALMPPALNWGPRALLSEVVRTGLASPIMHAFVYSEKRVPQRILVVGEGLRGIRNRVLDTLQAVSLRVHGGAYDLMNFGILHVHLPGCSVVPLDLPFTIMGDRREPLPHGKAETAEAALAELLGFLRSLEMETALVKVYEADITTLKEVTDTLRHMASEVFSGPPRIWAPSATEGKTTLPTDRGLATFVPYMKLGPDGDVLRFSLSPDLLFTRSYQRLLETYLTSTLERLLADLGTRCDLYQAQWHRHETEKKEYDSASQQERLRAWGPTVMVSERFDHITGETIKLAFPYPMSTDRYFAENVPHLIESYHRWYDEMRRQEEAFREAYKRDDSPGRRFAFSRFLDLAIRDRVPKESGAINAIFDTWCAELREMIWFEMRCELEKQNIDPREVANHHTFFHTLWTPTEGGWDIQELVMMPLMLFDPKCSAAVFDGKVGVMTIKDPTDFAVPVVTDEVPSAAEQAWDSLRTLAKMPDTTGQSFAEALRRHLTRTPKALLGRIVETVFGTNDDDNGTQTAEHRDIEALLEAARAKASVIRNMSQGYTAWAVGAVHTARRAVAQINPSGEWAWKMLVLSAVVECRAHGLDFADELSEAFSGRRPSAKEIMSLLEKARAANASQLKEWIEGLQSAGPGKSLMALLNELPKTEEVCSLEMRAALLARGGAEGARTARELVEAVRTLPEGNLSRAQILACCGLALERGILSTYGGEFDGDAYDLLAILAGREPLVYRRLE
jgi:hypothetical protein